MPSFFGPPTAVGSSKLRIQLTYWWRHRRLAQLRSPVLFTEWVQHRKLHDRDPRLPALADKVGVKGFVETLLGSHWVTPTLWRGTNLPAEPAWDYPYVVKSQHGCGHIAIVRNCEDHDGAARQSRRWMRQSYGAWLDEWLYGEIDRGLLVEPYIGDGQALPVDYKIFVFGGTARLFKFTSVAANVTAGSCSTFHGRAYQPPRLIQTHHDRRPWARCWRQLSAWPKASALFAPTSTTLMGNLDLVN